MKNTLEIYPTLPCLACWGCYWASYPECYHCLLDHGPLQARWSGSRNHTSVSECHPPTWIHSAIAYGYPMPWKHNYWCFRPRFYTVRLNCKATKGYKRITWATEMKFVMNHAPGAGSIAQPVNLQSSALWMPPCALNAHGYWDITWHSKQTVLQYFGKRKYYPYSLTINIGSTNFKTVMTTRIVKLCLSKQSIDQSS